MDNNIEIRKNEKKTLNTIIGIIAISLILIGINKLLYSNEVKISLIGYKRIWQKQHLIINFTISAILTLIYSFIIFNKKDFEKKEIWKSIICIIFLTVVPAQVSYFLLFQ